MFFHGLIGHLYLFFYETSLRFSAFLNSIYNVFLFWYHSSAVTWRILCLLGSPVHQDLPTFPSQPLSISIVRCCKITLCLLFDVQPSVWPPSLIVHANRNARFLSLSPYPSQSQLSTPVPFHLVTLRPFLASIYLVLFCSLIFSWFSLWEDSEIIWYLSFCAWLVHYAYYPVAPSLLL